MPGPSVLHHTVGWLDWEEEAVVQLKASGCCELGRPGPVAGEAGLPASGAAQPGKPGLFLSASSAASLPESALSPLCSPPLAALVASCLPLLHLSTQSDHQWPAVSGLPAPAPR